MTSDRSNNGPNAGIDAYRASGTEWGSYGEFLGMNRLVFGILATLASTGVAYAADIAEPPPEPAPVESGWTFTLAPYVWLAGIDGNVAQFGLPKVSIDASISDVLSNFDIGVMAAGEARYGRFSFATDLFYVKLSADKATPRGILADDVNVKVRDFMWTGAAAYSVIQEEAGNLDVMAGLRVWSVNTDLGFSGGPLDGISADDTDTWVDPIVGLKGRFNFTPNIYFTGWGMIGGFGASSKFMWDAMGGLGYSFNEMFSVVAGYRGMGVDYSHDGFVYDVVQHGPIFGGVIRF